MATLNSSHPAAHVAIVITGALSVIGGIVLIIHLNDFAGTYFGRPMGLFLCRHLELRYESDVRVGACIMFATFWIMAFIAELFLIFGPNGRWNLKDFTLAIALGYVESVVVWIVVNQAIKYSNPEYAK